MVAGYRRKLNRPLTGVASINRRRQAYERRAATDGGFDSMVDHLRSLLMKTPRRFEEEVNRNVRNFLLIQISLAERVSLTRAHDRANRRA